MFDESDIIAQFFNKPITTATVKLGIGDDAALTLVPPNHELVTTIDTLVAGVHFPSDATPEDLGYKAAVISLSDLAAMGAQPTTMLLSLTLEQAERTWLAAFAQGFFTILEQHHTALIGGNLTRGPLTISTVAHGIVPEHQALLRSGAQAGDLIYVTGNLGDAGLALDLLQHNPTKLDDYLHHRFYRPTPRVACGVALRTIASAAIDISDGLAQDLAKLLDASQIGARIQANKLPLSASMKALCTEQQAWQYALAAGEDYELCFCAPPHQQQQLPHLLDTLNCDYYCIGEVTAQRGLCIYDAAGSEITIKQSGYDHFKKSDNS